jgi:acetyl-CoA C-acetyltransferase
MCEDTEVYILSACRTPLGDLLVRDALVQGGLWCAYGDQPMGQAAEVAAEKYGISRQDQDAWALRSHQRAVKAASQGYFKDEVVRVEIPSADGGPGAMDADEGPRRDMTAEKLAQYPRAFKKDGTVTVGNASSPSDGAAALVLASDQAVKDQGLKPLARVLSTATAGMEPELALTAPRAAVEKVTADAGWKMTLVDLFEIEEVFAVQPLALIKALGLDPDKVNGHGGSVAMGQPAGATGARILVTLLHALRHRGLKKGVAALCTAGGDALAMAVEIV